MMETWEICAIAFVAYFVLGGFVMLKLGAWIYEIQKYYPPVNGETNGS